MPGVQRTSRRTVVVPPPVVNAVHASPLHVLIADADRESRAEREAQLNTAGCRISVARTAFETIVKASCHVPDVILLDESLGDGLIDTAEISRLLTTCPMTAHIPVMRLAPGRRLPQRLLSELRRGIVA